MSTCIQVAVQVQAAPFICNNYWICTRGVSPLDVSDVINFLFWIVRPFLIGALICWSQKVRGRLNHLCRFCQKKKNKIQRLTSFSCSPLTKHQFRMVSKYSSFAYALPWQHSTDFEDTVCSSFQLKSYTVFVIWQ